MIKFENVGVVYPGGVKALDNINLEINEGDFVIIVGLSGAGKSTLLRSINNLVKPTDGNVTVDGNNVTNASKKELIWQGQGTGYLTTNPEKKENLIQEFVNQILEKYPPTI